MVRLRHVWKSVNIGARFHRITVVGPQFRYHREKGKPRWVVVVSCECGKVKLVQPHDLLRGFVKSCGCHRVDVAIRMGKGNRRHGLEGTPLYFVWRSIKQRCNNPNQHGYHCYGGRGITYCKEWESFVPFMEWALKNGYSEHLQIDRRNNNGNYEPGNCRFVTPRTNSLNRRTTLIVEAFEETKTLSEWAEDIRCRVSYCTLWIRLFGKAKLTWTPEEAITTPPIPRPQRFSISN